MALLGGCMSGFSIQFSGFGGFFFHDAFEVVMESVRHHVDMVLYNFEMSICAKFGILKIFSIHPILGTLDAIYGKIMTEKMRIFDLRLQIILKL
jgi:hypothetical protein